MDSSLVLVSKQSANTPSLSASTTVLSSNTARAGFNIQNHSTATLYILLGTGASSTVFHFALKASTATDDGTGGSVSQNEGTVFSGPITAAGAPLRYTVMEL